MKKLVALLLAMMSLCCLTAVAEEEIAAYETTPSYEGPRTAAAPSPPPTPA